MKVISWLLLLFSLPTHRKTERVAVWRRFKKIGAIQIKTSAYLLPDNPPQYEHFQWLTQQIRDVGGDATLVRVQEIEGLSNEKLISLFNQARDEEYAAINRALHHLLARAKKTGPETKTTELERLKRQFRTIRETDFFQSSKGHDVQMLLRRAEGPPKKILPRLEAKKYAGKTWLTRPRPEIDRVGSAWLIRKFIDPRAKFLFGRTVPSNSKIIPFDMVDAELSHHDDCCTFETLIRRFGIEDKAVRKIAEMIHDADLEDEKFQRWECIGIDRVLKGWAGQGLPDEQILQRGFECFDGLYSFLQRL
ncbi:MAG TPA: chromate resistance protein ChrB domain-containing protein [Candidatus Udaeobacter sp.]|nr:chromate resistance protein ChrB domain-containing protein [Candidatus Udaeobacter sp.]